MSAVPASTNLAQRAAKYDDCASRKYSERTMVFAHKFALRTSFRLAVKIQRTVIASIVIGENHW
jgi:hypothetical protein